MRTAGAASHKPSGLHLACFSTWLPGAASPPRRRGVIAVDDFDDDDDDGEGPPGQGPEYPGEPPMRA